MHDRNKPIGVFDSGLGGLTVVQALRKELPRESIIYFGDTAHVPYGTKSAKTVTHFSIRIVDFLLKQDVKMIVVACNTASAVALPYLQNRIKIPIIGVIQPGVKAAVELTRRNHIGVIGTRATINSNAYSSALQEISSDLIVESMACPLFVPLAEEGWTTGSVVRKVADQYLHSFHENGIDTLILGCTHYPLLKETIMSALPDHVKLIDSAEAVSSAVKKLLLDRGALASSRSGTLSCFVTDFPQKFEELGERFLGELLPHVELVQMN